MAKGKPGLPPGQQRPGKRAGGMPVPVPKKK